MAIAAGAFVLPAPAPEARAEGPPLSEAEVTELVSRAVAYAKKLQRKRPLSVAVVDTEGNSLGVFRVPNDDWEYVVCQAGIYVDRADWARFSILKGAPGSESRPVGGGEYLMEDIPAGSGWGVTIETGPITVNSGDVLKAMLYSTTGNSIQNFSVWGNFFSIQGYKRTF